MNDFVLFTCGISKAMKESEYHATTNMQLIPFNYYITFIPNNVYRATQTT